jgi:hypothetical protein
MKMVEIIQTREIALCTKHQDESLTDDCLYCRIAELEEKVVDLGLERTKLLRFIARNEGAKAVQAALGDEDG